MKLNKKYFVHESSYVDSDVSIGENTKIWHFSHVQSGAIIGENCLIGAGSLIPEGKVIPPNSLVMGQPGQVKRQLNNDDMQQLAQASEHYVVNAQKYMESLCIQD